MPVTIHISPAPKKGKLKYTNMDAYLLLASVEQSLSALAELADSALDDWHDFKKDGYQGLELYKKMSAKHGKNFGSPAYCRAMLDASYIISKQVTDITEDEGMLTKTGKVKL